MAAINQRITNFLGGVSQQPDSIKFPGQLRVCDNAVPDVTFGLTKRPPGELVGKLTWNNSGTATPPTDNGYWYEILRDGDEKYLVQITPGATKPILIWDLADGSEKTVSLRTGTSDYSYLTGATKPYSLHSIQDLTVIANPDKTTAKTGTVPNNGLTGDYCFVKLDTLAYNTEYVLYKGDNTPQQNERYKVTETEPCYQSSSGASSFDDGNTTQSTGNNVQQGQYSGQGAYGDATAHPMGNRLATGRVIVNASTYLAKQDQHFVDDSGNESTTGQPEDFVGFKSTYRTRYFATTTLQHGGNYAANPVTTNNISQGTGVIAEVTVSGKNWKIKAKGTRIFHTYEEASNCVAYRTPENPDDGSLNMGLVLEKLKDKLRPEDGANNTASALQDNNNNNFEVNVVGNGLFIKGPGAHTINFLGGVVNEGMTVIGRTVTDVGQLPPSCKHGFTVEVSNTENTDSDNYFLKFECDDASTGAGPGRWVECACPHDLISNDDEQTLGLDPATMPHGLKNNRNGTFTFGKLDLQSNTDIMGKESYYWKDRDVGDIISNPLPTFVDKKIAQIFFHRNRLGFVANEQVVLSRPGDYFNFFNVSALTTSDDNPIDITVSDIKPAYINHVLPSQAGVMMFSDNGQFLFYTENDILSPKTARLKKVSGYECDPSIAPIDMGTSTMWASTVGAYTKTFEASIVDANAPPRVIEQTRVVPEYIPKDVTLSINSSALGLVTYGKKGDSNLYHYKYFESGDRRDQSAWFSWTLTGALQHGVYTAGDLYLVTKQGSDFILSRHEFVTASDANRSYTLGTGTVGSSLSTARWFEACLDNMQVKSNSDFTYVSADKYSHITLSYTPSNDDYNNSKIVAVVLSGDDAGTVIKAQPAASSSETILSSGTTAKFKNIDFTSSSSPKIAIGYQYDTIIELPTYYSSFEPGKNDLDGDLRISGINFEMGVSGPMEFELSSKYGDIDTYTQYESGMLIGTGQFSEPPAVLNKSVRVPIQRKNDKYTLKVKIPDPFTTSLISASWDGRYNTRRHVRK